MGRHSRPDGAPPRTVAGRRLNAPPRREHPVAPGAPTDGAEASAPATDSPDPAQYSTTLDDTALIPLAVGPDAPATPVRAATAGNVLVRPADPTRVIPRVRPDVQSPWIPGPGTDTAVDGAPNDDDAHDGAHNDDGDDYEDNDEDNVAEARHRRSGWVWAGLAVFWLLALGAGLVTLASLGAPHFLCTGSSAKGLACHTAGTVIAAILTVALIVAVGTVSVLAIETRATGRAAWRWLGTGVVVLVVVASCGYLLIRTIGG